MRKLLVSTLTLTMLAAALIARAQEMPEMPKPQKEHEWLQQLVGEWTSDYKISMPGEPDMVCKGTETVSSLGGFWTISEGTVSFEGMTNESRMTLGYDPAKKQYIGTYADGMGSHLWHYTGSVDESGKALTLDTGGPCPMKGGAMTDFRETLTITDADHRTFTSAMKNDDGTWTTFVTVNYTRKK